MQVETISTEELGDRSYVVSAAGHAVVVDPQRDIDRVEAVLARFDVRVDLVVETHIHNDYVTGGFELARRTGARYAVNAADHVSFDRLAVRDSDVLEAGPLRVRVLDTPGHTDTHLAYVVTDTGDPDAPAAVFTGGSLLYGSVGRTDLVDPARTDELTRAQFQSARRLGEILPDETPVFPTHGFGSFCSTGSALGATDSTIGVERSRNDAFTAPDEQTFVERLVANLTAYPAYYAHMAPLNRQGPPAPPADAPSAVDPAELAKRIAAGEWIIDLRDRVAYAADHLAGTISIALGTQFATYVGWLAPWQTAITLIGESPAQIDHARRDLSRIGIDRLAGAATGGLDDLTDDNQARAHYPRITFADLTASELTASELTASDRTSSDGTPTDSAAGEGAFTAAGVVLDVRRDDERAAGFIPGSLHVPLHSLLDRIAELPTGRRLFVHCASGFRASIAASLLDRAGLPVIYIDDEYRHAVDLGLANS
jgi:hydroxyacylglutathione hydrolase